MQFMQTVIPPICNTDMHRGVAGGDFADGHGHRRTRSHWIRRCPARVRAAQSRDAPPSGHDGCRQLELEFKLNLSLATAGAAASPGAAAGTPGAAAGAAADRRALKGFAASHCHWQ